MMKWMMIIPMIILIGACSRTTNQLGNEELEVDTDLSPKSGEVVTQPLRVYDDLKVTGEGTMLSSKEIANKICYCAFEITRINDDIKRYHRNNDKNSLLNVRPKIDAAYAKFDRCMAELKTQYPKAVVDNDPEGILEEVKKQCPKLLDIMEAGNQNIMGRGTKED